MMIVKMKGEGECHDMAGTATYPGAFTFTNSAPQGNCPQAQPRGPAVPRGVELCGAAGAGELPGHQVYASFAEVVGSTSALSQMYYCGEKNFHLVKYNTLGRALLNFQSRLHASSDGQ